MVRMHQIIHADSAAPAVSGSASLCVSNYLDPFCCGNPAYSIIFSSIWAFCHKPVEMLITFMITEHDNMGLVYTSLCSFPWWCTLISAVDKPLPIPSLIEAACDPGRSFKLISNLADHHICSHCKPGITSGAIVVFMLTSGQLPDSQPDGRQELRSGSPSRSTNQFIASFNWNQGSAFGLLLLIQFEHPDSSGSG